MKVLYTPHRKQRQLGRASCLVPRAFTLVELLVSMGLFILIMTVALTIYTSTIRAQRLTVSSNRIQRDIQTALGIITKSIRSSGVDYRPGAQGGYYNGTVPAATSTLAILDRDKNLTLFHIKNSAIEVKQGSSGTYQAMTSSDVLIQSLTFFITPATDPFTNPSNLPLVQPKVTVVLKAAPVKSPNASVTVQQTIPQRSGGY